MFSGAKDVWGHLRADIVYETYSDEKLAKLYLDNADDFPVDVFSEVLDVLLDPLFKLEDITFKSVRDIFTRISTYRRENLSMPNLGRQILSSSTTDPEPLAPRASAIPTDVVSLVVDKMVENRTPLGEASMEEGWRRAYSNDVADFHAMSLVHRSWTAVARGGLRRRAIIPYHQLNSFIMSPLCGPWVTELIIYWTVNNGTIGITFSDIDLFEALLRRVPNVHSLAFDTSLVWLTYDYFPWNTGEMPPLRVDYCLELVSDLLPSLENLWLNHFSPDVDEEGMSESLEACREMRSLFTLIPHMQSLKRLSLNGWAEVEGGEGEVDWNEYPSPNLRALELIGKVELSRRRVNWLIKPRNGFNLQSLSISIQQLRLIEYPLPNLKELRLYMLGIYPIVLPNSLEKYEQLVRLDLFVYGDLDLGSSVFLKNLEHITFNMFQDNLCWLLAQPIPAHGLRTWQSSSNFVPLMKEHLSYLTRLQSIGLISSLYGAWMGNRVSDVEDIPEGKIPRNLLDLCGDHSIRVICRQVSGARSRRIAL